MPYRTNAELPESIKAAIQSKDGLDLFREVVNSALRRDADEGQAMRMAWGALKRAGYEKQDGVWVKVVKKALTKAEYKGREVELDKPFRLPEGGDKKFAVYVKDGDEVKRVEFGSAEMEIKRDDPEARASFRARFDCENQTDKTSAAYWSCKMWQDNVTVDEMINKGFELNCRFEKRNDEKQLVYGFASVIEKDGKPVVDKEGDVITEQMLLEAAHNYVIKSRQAKVMHEGKQKGELVESLVLTGEVKKLLKSDLNMTGWLVGFKITDKETWEKVKSGELKMFSIGGKGRRVEQKDV